MKSAGFRGWMAAIGALGISMSPARAEGDSLFRRVVFQAGAEGYHTYRIPAVIVSPSGTLLAFCEGRKTSSADSGDIDIVLKRSTDGGATWGPLIVVQEEGGTASITIGNPAPLVDPATGTLWLPFCRNNSKVFVTSSTDDGLTWSTRQEITANVKLPTWGWYATGPCHSIALTRGAHTGRLLVPCDHQTGSTWGAHVIYSDDHGATWTLGGTVEQATAMGPNESVAVELVDGRVYLNSRNQSTGHRRVIAYSSDGGETFSAPAMDSLLLDPIVQASALRVKATDKGDSGNLILFSNPATTSSRTRLTVRRSADETGTWDAGKVIESGPSAYSDLVKLADGRIGLLFETGAASAYETITFACFSLSYLDLPEPPDAIPSSADWRLNEKAPGAAADTTAGAILDTHRAGKHLNLTVSGALTYVAGDPRYGSTPALAFTGSQKLFISDLATGNQLDFGAGDSFTLEALIRVPNGSTQVGNVVGKDVGSDQPSWWFRVETGKMNFFVDDGAHHVSAWSTTSVNDGAWHHVAGVRDTALKQVRVYVDGALEGTAADPTVASLANGNAVTVGMYNAGSRAFTGDVDFVRISNRVLSPGQFIPQDHDGDGMATQWETDHGLDPYDDGSIDPRNGAAGDADGDGVSNLDEYLADTNPRSADSYLWIDTIHPEGNGVAVQLDSSSARVYALECRSGTATSSWEQVTGEVTGVDGPLILRDATPSVHSRLYRISVAAP